MGLDTAITAVILIAAFYVLFFIGKIVNDKLHPEYDLNHELVESDNPALALAVAGYYGGLVLTLGGALVGPTHGIWRDLQDMAVYGVLGIVLLNLSWFFCDWVILRQFKISDELVRDRNQGAGAVSAGVSLANGFILFGSLQGVGGGPVTAIAFWAIGQLMLFIAGLVYNWITPYNIHDLIEQDNVAAGVGFGGALTAMGIVIGLAAEADFVSWEDNLPAYLIYAGVGLCLLPAARFLTDKLLLPGVNLTDEIAHQETPNVGAAYLEAFSYIAAAFIIYWCV